jgi:phosphoglycolate phosphatase
MRTNARLLVFDLDGTLADTRKDLAKATNASLQSVSLPSLPLEIIITFVGEGAEKLIRRCFNYLQCSDEARLCRAVEFFYPYYYEHVQEDTQLYSGVAETLVRLASPKAVLTNKTTRMSRKLLEALGAAHYFEDIVGGDKPEELKPNPCQLVKLIAKHGVTAENTWMVGDSPIDIETARNAGAKSVAVGYGLYTPEDLKKARPDVLIDTFNEIVKLELL